MDLKAYFISSLFNGLIGLFLMLIGYILFDIITYKMDFADVFKRDKITNGGVIIGCFFIGLAIIVASTAG